METNNGQLIQALCPISSQTVSISGTTAASTAITTKIIRIISTVDCFIAFGEAATTSKMFLPAGTIEYFPLNGVSTISAITSGSSGTLYVSGMY